MVCVFTFYGALFISDQTPAMLSVGNKKKKKTLLFYSPALVSLNLWTEMTLILFTNSVFSKAMRSCSN